MFTSRLILMINFYQFKFTHNRFDKLLKNLINGEALYGSTNGQTLKSFII